LPAPTPMRGDITFSKSSRDILFGYSLVVFVNCLKIKLMLSILCARRLPVGLLVRSLNLFQSAFLKFHLDKGAVLVKGIRGVVRIS